MEESHETKYNPHNPGCSRQHPYHWQYSGRMQCKKETQTLNVAVMPATDAENVDAETQEKVNEDLRQTLEEKLGCTVNIFDSTEYAVGITALAEGNLDVLLVSPMSYYQASLQAEIEPLVTYSSAPGSAVYKSVFITRADNEEINTMEDLEGKTFAFVDQASSSGYLYPKYTLVESLDLDVDSLENAGYFFNSVIFSGSHVNSIIAVLNGSVDAAAVAYATLDYMPMTAPPLKADRKEGLSPPFAADSAVFTLAMVATKIPILPAAAEKIVPAM